MGHANTGAGETNSKYLGKRVKKMKNIFGMMCALAMACMLAISGCAGASKPILDNGHLSPVWMASIKFSVGLGMSARPETVAPAYRVSGALLAVMDGEESVLADGLKDAIAKRTEALGFDRPTMASFDDLVDLVTANIQAELDGLALPESERLVVVRDVVSIIHDAAAARIPPAGGAQ